MIDGRGSITLPELLVMYEKTVVELFPPAIWKKYEKDAEAFFTKPLEKINWARGKNKNRVNHFIEGILAAPSADEIAQLLETVDPLLAILYKDRLDGTMAYLKEAAPPEMKIQFQCSWSDLLKKLLIRP